MGRRPVCRLVSRPTRGAVHARWGKLRGGRGIDMRAWDGEWAPKHLQKAQGYRDVREVKTRRRSARWRQVPPSTNIRPGLPGWVDGGSPWGALSTQWLLTRSSVIQARTRQRQTLPARCWKALAFGAGLPH